MNSDVIEQARKEVNDEQFKLLVEKEKQRIKQHNSRPFWTKVFPFTIKIERK